MARLDPTATVWRVPRPKYERADARDTLKRTVPLDGFRIEHLRRWHVIEGVCAGCGQIGEIRQGVLTATRPEHFEVAELTGKLRCKECGNRDGNTLSVRTRPR